MKLNLTGVKSTASSPHKRDAKAKHLDQNSKILFSNSLHYKVILEDEQTTKRKFEERVNLPISSSTKVNLSVNIPQHRTNVHIEKHDPGKVSVANPLALTAQEHAFIEETMAKSREVAKKERADAFHHNTRVMLLKKMEDLEHEKARAQYETTEKIKKLLSDTIEFSQKTALAAKKAI
jgi:hypothetical protein